MTVFQQQELPICMGLFPERDRDKDCAALVDALMERFKKTRKFDVEKPFGHTHYLLDVAQILFGIDDSIPLNAWHGYTREQFQYAEEVWNRLGEFVAGWWEKNKP